MTCASKPTAMHVPHATNSQGTEFSSALFVAKSTTATPNPMVSSGPASSNIRDSNQRMTAAVPAKAGNSFCIIASPPSFSSPGTRG